jgi:hypothetical protein
VIFLRWVPPTCTSLFSSPPPPTRSSCLANLDLFISIRDTDNEDLHHSVFFRRLPGRSVGSETRLEISKQNDKKGRKEERKEVVTKREDILLILNPLKTT